MRMRSLKEQREVIGYFMDVRLHHGKIFFLKSQMLIKVTTGIMLGAGVCI